MARGLEVYNADGTLQFSTARRGFRLVQINLTGTTNGSVTVAPTTPAYSVAVLQNRITSAGTMAKVTVSGNNVSWDFTGISTKADSRLMIGIM